MLTLVSISRKLKTHKIQCTNVNTFMCFDTKLWKKKITISWNLILHKQKYFHELKTVKSLKKFYSSIYSENYYLNVAITNGLSMVGIRPILGFTFFIPVFIWIKGTFLFCSYLLSNYNIIVYLLACLILTILMRAILPYYRKINRLSSVGTRNWIKAIGFLSLNTMLYCLTGIYLIFKPIKEN